MIKNIIRFFDRTRQHSQLSVPHIDGEEEYQTEVRGLQQQVYEFWVTAATASGEGEMSAVVSRKPNTKGERIFNVSLKYPLKAQVSNISVISMDLRIENHTNLDTK